MPSRTPTSVVVGIDPGSTAGVAAVCFKSPRHPKPHVVAGLEITRSTKGSPDHADWLTSVKVLGSLADLDLALHAQGYRVDRVVLEQPVDARPFWSSQKGGRREGAGTAFRSGLYYAMALIGAYAVWPDVPIRSFPVHDHGRGKGRREGWMPKKQARGHALAVGEMLVQAGSLPLKEWRGKEHQLMAAAIAFTTDRFFGEADHG